MTEFTSRLYHVRYGARTRGRLHVRPTTRFTTGCGEAHAMHRFLAAALMAVALAHRAPGSPVVPPSPATTGTLGRTTGGIDGVVVRGRLRARIAVGGSLVRVDGDPVRDVRESRRASTLTFERTAGGTTVPTVIVRVARLRGVATSGDVDLTVDDRSDRPLFLDLAGSGKARLRGAVPLARTTTSGTVVADFSALRAASVRVHARERSRARFAAYDHLTVVAVDHATVEYDGPSPDRVTLRNRAIVRRLRRERRIRG